MVNGAEKGDKVKGEIKCKGRRRREKKGNIIEK